MSYYEIEELEYLRDNELISKLKLFWGYTDNEPIEVSGELSCIETNIGLIIYKIHNVRSLKTNLYLEYPIKNLEQNQLITTNGVFATQNSMNKELKKSVREGNKIYITCHLELSSEKERKKHNNPFLLNTSKNSVQKLYDIEKEFFIYNNERISIKESILRFLENEYKKEEEQLFKKLTLKSRYLEEQITNFETKINSHNNKLSIEFEKLNSKYDEEANKVKDKIYSLKKDYEEKVSEFEFNIEKLEEKVIKKEKSLKQLDENKNLIIDEIEEKNKEKQSLLKVIEDIKIEIERIEETMSKKLEKFRNFIKEKATQLLKLEFIDQEEYDNLLMIKKEENINKKTISFKNDLSSDYQKAISNIHSYLFNQDIIYPRYILEDFMALIQTNDLIILAGESGSGKTNLVKSFAKAIGGKSFIIPVKPNWTSAEDLLGYYNPLEKKYLTTPFLEALLEAKNNPDIPYFICLDEMNLARVEYYFADFLSLLEERDSLPEIQLYSDDESSHVLSEFKNVLEIINSVKEKYKKNNLVDFVSILKDEEVNNELKRVFGFSDKDSLIKYHTDLRKMISGIINTPSSIEFPKNVRIIGAINIDETTHYLSPKILDRAHIMKFDSPLLYDWTIISSEIEDNVKSDHIVKFEIDELGMRVNYPSYDKDDLFCQTITSFTKKYFQSLGIEVGLRTIRQGLNYQNIFKEQESNENLVLNNFILHKILPKMTFDSKKNDRKDKLLSFKETLKEYIDENLATTQSVNVIKELEELIKNSEANDDIVNYWA